MADVCIENHGSVAIVQPLTDEGRAWIAEHVESESWQWFGGGLAAEPRYVEALVDGMRADGLEVE